MTSHFRFSASLWLTCIAPIVVMCAACSQTRSFVAINNPPTAAAPNVASDPSGSSNRNDSNNVQALPISNPALIDSASTYSPYSGPGLPQGEPANDVSFVPQVQDFDSPSVGAGTVTDDQQPPPYGKRIREDLHEMWPEIVQDYKNYYSLENAARLAVGFGVGAALANTDVDQKIRDWYQNDVRSSGTDQFARIAKPFGNGEYVVGAVTAGWLAGELFYDHPAGDALSLWGQRSLRSIAVGAPPMLLMQYVTGGSRPGETSAESHWKPFTDNNGVSGHSFACAVPFINAAQMTDEWPLKLGFYACSTLAGLSRINDDAHYTSQVILGWWMAYCAATAVDETGPTSHHWSVTPLPMAGGAGMAVTYQY